MTTTYSIQDAAKIAGVNRLTVRRWISSGKLGCIRGRGRRKAEIPASELRAFLIEKAIFVSTSSARGVITQHMLPVLRELEAALGIAPMDAHAGTPALDYIHDLLINLRSRNN